MDPLHLQNPVQGSKRSPCRDPKRPRAEIQNAPVQGFKTPPCRDPKPLVQGSPPPVQRSQKNLKMICFAPPRPPCKDPPSPVQRSVFEPLFFDPPRATQSGGPKGVPVFLARQQDAKNISLMTRNEGPHPRLDVTNSVPGRLGIFRGGIVWERDLDTPFPPYNRHFDLGRGSKKGDAIRGCNPDRREAKEILMRIPARGALSLKRPSQSFPFTIWFTHLLILHL